MSVAIQPLSDEFVPAVKAFNSRLDSARVPFDLRFPEAPLSDWLPKLDERRLYQENFIVLENGIMRGGFRVKRQDFSFRGKVVPVDCFHWPMSEAVINNAYSWLFLLMLRHVQKTHPLLYSLGMAGSEDTLIPRILKSAGWKVRTLPFFFKINHPTRFLREIQALRTSGFRRSLLDAAARTAIAPLAIKAIQRARTARPDANASAQAVHEFGAWADDLWNDGKDRYAMAAVRDSTSLNLLYPAGDRFLKYRIYRGAETVGWVVLLNTQMNHNKYFGNMRVGTILDGFAHPENASHVISLAAQILREGGADLIVSNQLETHWCTAFSKAGFFHGPSNFSFGVSPELSNLLSPFECVAPLVHMTRGDGEGPLHL
jgi:hypothetical protein